MITLNGFYLYMPELFDDFSYLSTVGIIPDTLKRRLIMFYGEQYPYHQVPEILKQNIHDFVIINLPNWESKYKAYITEYKPLENYNRMETSTTTDNGGWSGTNEQTQTMDDVGKNAQSTTDGMTGNSNGTVTPNTTVTETGSNDNNVSAYNSSAYQPFNKSFTDNTRTESGTTTNVTDVSSDATQDIDGSYEQSRTNVTQGSDGRNTNNTKTYTDDAHGNIGVTTSQQMLQAELDLRNWVLYDEIMIMFSDNFLYKVY